MITARVRLARRYWQANQMYGDLNRRLKFQVLIRLNKYNLGILAGFLTGQCKSKIIGVEEQEVYRSCQEGKETLHHLLIRV